MDTHNVCFCGEIKKKHHGEVREISVQKIFVWNKLFIPHHTVVAGYYGITLAVPVSVHLSYLHPSVFSFPHYNLSKCRWILTKLGVCNDIVEIWFGIVNGQILSNL